VARGTRRPSGFGGLLKGHRLAAGLTQEALAARVALSARAVSDLERGVNRAPYRETVALLAGALRLPAADRAALEATVTRRRGPLSRMPAAPPALRRVEPEGGPAGPANLPLPLTSFVGRERELAEVARHLGTTRLLTLTGPGGIGKTRLALRAAAAARPAYPDGVWLVELAALADPALVPPAVAAVVGVREEPGRPLPATLTEACCPSACSSSSITASIWWRPAPGWPTPCCGPAPACVCWRPVARRWPSPERPPGACRRSPCRIPATRRRSSG
jgi:transcriptional regulator with XRE-family HTH domain